MWLSEKLQRMGERFRGSVGRLQGAFHRSPPAFRRGAAMLVDALIVMESFAVALLFRFNGEVPYGFWRTFWVFALFSVLAFVLLLNWNGVYQSVESPAELHEQGPCLDVRVLSATAMAAGGLFIAVFAIGPFGFGIMKFNPVPLSVPLIGSVLAYVQLVAVRLLYPRAIIG